MRNGGRCLILYSQPVTARGNEDKSDSFSRLAVLQAGNFSRLQLFRSGVLQLKPEKFNRAHSNLNCKDYDHAVLVFSSNMSVYVKQYNPQPPVNLGFRPYESEALLSGIAHQLGSLYALVLHLKLGGSQLSLEMLNDHTLMS